MAEKKTYWQRRQRNAYAGAAAGGAAGAAGGYKLIRRGPSGTKGLAAAGAASAGGLGAMGGLVAGAKATRKKKVKKNMSVSAFGVDHGDIEKALNPVKAVKGAMKVRGEKNYNRNFQRGHNQAMKSQGIGVRGEHMPTLFGGATKKGSAGYRAGQAAGQSAARVTKNPLPDPFR